MLSEHTAAFSLNNGVEIVYRIKDVGKVGGIMSTIRAGKDVAPAALPDAALIRRRDFTPAQAQQYLQSMETLFSSSLINDLDDGLEFGQVALQAGIALYGLPYLYDVLLAVHLQPLQTAGARLTFADVIANDTAFLFPAARANGLNQTFYQQYLSAGGFSPRDGAMSIDEAALGAVLQFYEDLVQRGLVAADVLTFQSPAAYQSEFINRADPRAAGGLQRQRISRYDRPAGFHAGGGACADIDGRRSLYPRWLAVGAGYAGYEPSKI